jgi:dephospho-CoA kinase
MPPNEALKIGITGNIGSGKSSFCHYLEELGQKVLYADAIAHEILIELSPLWAKKWGEQVLQDGKADRAKISELVFSDPQKLAFLNSQIHPRVKKRFAEEQESSAQPVLCFEIPLLFEAGWEDYFDFLVLIKAPPKLVLQRLKMRNPGQIDNLQLRLSKQIPDSKKAAWVDLVIENDQGFEQLREQAKQLIALFPKIPRAQSKAFD